MKIIKNFKINNKVIILHITQIIITKDITNNINIIHIIINLHKIYLLKIELQ